MIDTTEKAGVQAGYQILYDLVVIHRLAGPLAFLEAASFVFACTMHEVIHILSEQKEGASL